MSEKSLKRYLKQRDKKERGQLTTRRHLGLLEKKKDYKMRASDFRRKRDHIRELQKKAELRNPDEFHHEMEQKVVDSHGHVVSTQQSNRLTSQMKKDKEVDTAFLQQKIQIKRREITQSRANLAALDQLDHTQRQHVIYVEDDDEVDNWNAAEHFNTLPQLVSRAHNRLTKEQLESDIILNKSTPGMLHRADQAKLEQYTKVREEEKVLRDMQRVHDDTVLKRHLMTGGRVKKLVKKDIFGDEIKAKTRYKWKSERKR